MFDILSLDICREIAGNLLRCDAGLHSSVNRQQLQLRNPRGVKVRGQGQGPQD